VLCKVCRSPSHKFFDARVLGKYAVAYLRCENCGFVQTEEPYWLNESYLSAINEIDLGPVNRGITGSNLVEGIILSSLDRTASFVDYGAGYGLFVRMMRDRGFDFFWQDRYCENLFAKHFVAEHGNRYELLTAFEVFEHLVDPLAELSEMLKLSENILFSTLLLPQSARAAEDWWYFAPEHGQHIAFYTVKSLQILGKHFGLNFATDGTGVHILSKKPISSRVLTFFSNESWKSRFVRKLLRRRLSRQSLLRDDFKKVSGHQI
jgi:hypothetical protein